MSRVLIRRGCQDVEDFFVEHPRRDVIAVFGLVQFGLHCRVFVMGLEVLDTDIQLFLLDCQVLPLGDFGQYQADLDLVGGRLFQIFFVFFFCFAFGFQELLEGLYIRRCPFLNLH